ncbi:hypothetical protein H3V53_03180 [Paraburkholderia bengalensis]|uniref:Uncharacterized protein n=1 Tax=Paraburkholderia bengalensis TaxID=2747562 RepID=A0ABU8IKW6_9BURK
MTLSGEGRDLGILMAEAMFTLSMRMRPLGLQTPLHDIVDAVAAQKVHIVALSFTASLPRAVRCKCSPPRWRRTRRA